MLQAAEISNTKYNGKATNQTNSIGSTSVLGLLRRIVLVEIQQEEAQQMGQFWLLLEAADTYKTC